MSIWKVADLMSSFIQEVSTILGEASFGNPVVGHQLSDESRPIISGTNEEPRSQESGSR